MESILDKAIGQCLECDKARQFQRLSAYIPGLFKALQTEKKGLDERIPCLLNTAKRFTCTESKLLFYNTVLWSGEMSYQLANMVDERVCRTFEFQVALCYFRRQNPTRTIHHVSSIRIPSFVYARAEQVIFPEIAAFSTPMQKLKAQNDHFFAACKLLTKSFEDSRALIAKPPVLIPYILPSVPEQVIPVWSKVQTTLNEPRWHFSPPDGKLFDTPDDYDSLVANVFRDSPHEQYISPSSRMDTTDDDGKKQQHFLFTEPELKTWQVAIPTSILPRSKNGERITIEEIIDFSILRHVQFVSELVTVKYLVPIVPIAILSMKLEFAQNKMRVRVLSDTEFLVEGTDITHKDTLEFCFSINTFMEVRHEAYHKYLCRCREFSVPFSKIIRQQIKSVREFLNQWHDSGLFRRWVFPSVSYGVVIVRERSESSDAIFANWELRRVSFVHDGTTALELMDELHQLINQRNGRILIPFDKAELPRGFVSISRLSPRHEITNKMKYVADNFELWVPIVKKVMRRTLSLFPKQIDEALRRSSVNIVGKTSTHHVCTYEQFNRLVHSPIDSAHLPMQFVWGDLIDSPAIVLEPSEGRMITSFYERDRALMEFLLAGWYPPIIRSRPYIFSNCYVPGSVTCPIQPLALERKFAKPSKHFDIFSKGWCNGADFFVFDQATATNFKWNASNQMRLELNVSDETGIALHMVVVPSSVDGASISTIQGVKLLDMSTIKWHVCGILRDSLNFVKFDMEQKDGVLRINAKAADFIAFFFTSNDANKHPVENLFSTLLSDSDEPWAQHEFTSASPWDRVSLLVRIVV